MRTSEALNKAVRQQGFTLLEVLVALIFVAFGVVTVIEVTARHVDNVTELEKRVLATWVASNQIAVLQHESLTDRVKTGSKTKRVEMGGVPWRARYNIKRTEVERVFLLTVEVFDEKSDSKTPYATLTSAVTESL